MQVLSKKKKSKIKLLETTAVAPLRQQNYWGGSTEKRMSYTPKDIAGDQRGSLSLHKKKSSSKGRQASEHHLGERE